MEKIKSFAFFVLKAYLALVVINGIAGFFGGSALLNPIGYWRAKNAAAAAS